MVKRLQADFSVIALLIFSTCFAIGHLFTRGRGCSRILFFVLEDRHPDARAQDGPRTRAGVAAGDLCACLRGQRQHISEFIRGLVDVLLEIWCAEVGGKMGASGGS